MNDRLSQIDALILARLDEMNDRLARIERWQLQTQVDIDRLDRAHRPFGDGSRGCDDEWPRSRGRR